MAALKKAATKKVAKKAVGAPRGRAAQAMEFTQSLVLNQWLFGLFGLDSTDGYYTLDGGRRVPLLEAFKQRFTTAFDHVPVKHVHPFECREGFVPGALRPTSPPVASRS